MKVSKMTMRIGNNAGYYTPVDCFRFRAQLIPELWFNEDAPDQQKEIEKYSRVSLMCEKALQNNGMKEFI